MFAMRAPQARHAPATRSIDRGAFSGSGARTTRLPRNRSAFAAAGAAGDSAGRAAGNRQHPQPPAGHPVHRGVRAGTIDEPGTINDMVSDRLKAIAAALREQGVRETRVVQEPAPAPQPPKPPGPPEPPR